jgi:dipeptidase E
MKLYLSSYGFGNKSEQFVKLIGVNKKVAVILNAQDYASPEKRSGKLRQEIMNLKTLGLDPEELDLRHYFDNPDALKEKLAAYGAVWIRGGNVFVLMGAMKRSGFDVIIQPLVLAERIVYAGFSAGSAAASPTLHGIELVDDPRSVPSGYADEPIWDGLGFVEYSIAPHYRSDHPESEAIEKVVVYFIEHKMPYKTLRDGEAIVVDGEYETVVG